ncbi:hypothetical protein PICMEDRAFT_33929 [Pichia membranifaciens NRRL Y-2026]|uniref:Uncharacterized protein n=1 Tax=Pichia membranifaciens NRRL Y-2026 TaxID=763406 RepID=A0A1E3NLC6_9ASCO|nr:hypothetical protein PICMEDRAFT_33929 [Pichia membranifaciens NRRL Y-2026]ODQ46945.1 hypothetical protein PICMEDRAFT_33929 [Pichia membranifaciens NRRL Y-2026]
MFTATLGPKLAELVSLSQTAAAEPGPLREQLSSVFGSISFACWMILMVPQLVEQWRLKTVDGISPLFLLIWSSGDVFNLVGSVWAGLLPEVTLIACWFLLADFITLAFYLYIAVVYDRRRKARAERRQRSASTNVVYGATDSSQPQPPHPHHHHHHHHEHTDRRKSQSSTLHDIVYEPENHSIFVKYTLPILLVICAGTFGSILSPNKVASASSASSLPPAAADSMLGPQIFGYLSAALYLTARLPQIYHNYQKKSTKGLSLLFFLFTMLGNITYSLQIVAYRSDSEYLMLNLSWLLGSFGTIAEDVIIVTQFYLYRHSSTK